MASNSHVIQLTDQQFNAIINNDKEIPVLVGFGAPWCTPCRAIGPMIHEIANEFQGKIKVCKYDVSENQDFANKYCIQSVPVIMTFKNGNVMGQINGATNLTKDSLLSMIYQVI